MRLKEEDWGGPQGVKIVEFEYPDGPIAEFMNWLRCTKAWREEPTAVERRLSVLNRQLLPYKNDPLLLKRERKARSLVTARAAKKAKADARKVG